MSIKDCARIRRIYSVSFHLREVSARMKYPVGDFCSSGLLKSSKGTPAKSKLMGRNARKAVSCDHQRGWCKQLIGCPVFNKRLISGNIGGILTVQPQFGE